ncbi:MAG: F0F1 ATP synthase subunit A [Planctomycetes bacterium]|nr:F0F1 ATP synthase subunit A [Planctomycetota bacterium]
MFLAEGNFNPVEHLYDRAAAWVSLWGVHGEEFINGWNSSMPGFMHLSQHSIMMMAATALVLLMVTYVTYLRNGRVPRGLRNFVEPIALFVRNEIARPNIKSPHAHGHGDHGHEPKDEKGLPEHQHEHAAQDASHDPAPAATHAHEEPGKTEREASASGTGHEHDHAHEAENPYRLADMFSPFLACTFFFIAAINLIGLIPGSTTATGAATVTMGFAALTLFTYVIGSFYLQIKQNGLVGGVKSWFLNLVPYHFSTKPLDLGIWFLLLGIEFIGMLAKPFALTVRLFANMTAGHCIILSLLFINQIVATGAPGTYWPIATGVPTVLMSVAIYGLEIFVAILQAYIFTYLSAIFIGSYLVPEH